MKIGEQIKRRIKEKYPSVRAFADDICMDEDVITRILDADDSSADLENAVKVCKKLEMSIPGFLLERSDRENGERACSGEMTVNEYQRLAMRTLNPALLPKDVLINGVMGLCGEAGEAIDIVKKHLAQGHELNSDALVKELGDVAWYLAETAYALGIPLEEVFRRNIEKLKNRYPEGFETEKSVNRGE